FLLSIKTVEVRQDTLVKTTMVHKRYLILIGIGKRLLEELDVPVPSGLLPA
ncbi:MAG: hypothetical protein ACI9J3_003750, partial [Parvicellaceae bacterium]